MTTKLKPRTAKRVSLRHRTWDHLCVAIEDGVAEGHLWLRTEDYEGEIEDRKRAALVAVAVLKALAERFNLTPEAVEAVYYNAMGGHARAHKHVDDPPDDAVQATERQYIEGGLAELLPEGEE